MKINVFGERCLMVHVGLDIPSKHISICALSETGQVAQRCRMRSIEEMLRILQGLPDRVESVMLVGTGDQENR